jgi:hypothetical protein
MEVCVTGLAADITHGKLDAAFKEHGITTRVVLEKGGDGEVVMGLVKFIKAEDAVKAASAVTEVEGSTVECTLRADGNCVTTV